MRIAVLLVGGLALGCAASTEAPRCASASDADDAIARAPAPRDWRRYAIPAHWSADHKDMARAMIVGSVGRSLLRDGWIDEVIVDDRTGVVWARANETGHDEVIRDLGGCVLYPEPECIDCIITVVALLRADGATVARRLTLSASSGVRVTVDAPTNSLVLSGPTREVRRLASEARRIDCSAP
jgi:hypothetical protein